MMTKTLIAAIAATTALAAPAFAHDSKAVQAGVPAWVYTDANSHYLDYKTDLSEARRELAKDLADADSESDRVEVQAEYEAEVADAEKDFRKEMAEMGIAIPEGTVTLEGEVALLDPRD